MPFPGRLRVCAIMAPLLALSLLGACQQENPASSNGGNWKVECDGRFSGPCIAVYQPIRHVGSQVSFVGALPFNGSGQAAGGLTIVIPARAILPPGLIVEIGDTPARSYPIGLCDRRYCVVKAGLTAGQFAALRQEKSMRLSYFHSASGNDPEIASIDLDGLAAVLDELARMFTEEGWPETPVVGQI